MTISLEYSKAQGCFHFEETERSVPFGWELIARNVPRELAEVFTSVIYESYLREGMEPPTTGIISHEWVVFLKYANGFMEKGIMFKIKEDNIELN